MMRLLPLSLVLTLAACATPVAHTGFDTSATIAATIRAERGSITSTLVIPATVQAGVEVQITAPAAGTYTANEISRLLPAGLVLDHVLVKSTRHVPQHFPIAVGHTSGFALVAPLTETALLRLYSVPTQANGQIKDGPGPFTCPLADRVPRQGSDGPTLTCLIPADLTVFAGMPAMMAVRTASAQDVIVLPVEAVAGSSQHGQVWIVDAQGHRQLRDVQLGITDGVQIEIRDGLTAGDSVLEPAPNLDRP